MTIFELALVLVVGVTVFMCAYNALGMDVVKLVRSVWRIQLPPAMPRAGPKALSLAKARMQEKGRRASIARDMPTFLDIVTLGLCAGLSFDASVELYCKRCQTPLALALSDALLLWRIGAKSRAEALQELADELQVPAMTHFASTVTEAIAFGTPLSKTLERQAEVIRDEQRAMVEEEIERVPVKMLIPLGTLIVPAMLLAILGPLIGPALGMA